METVLFNRYNYLIRARGNGYPTHESRLHFGQSLRLTKTNLMVWIIIRFLKRITPLIVVPVVGGI